MQTTTLPIPLAIASPNAAPAPQRANAAPKADARQFSDALSREMEQRRPAAAPAGKPQGAPKEAAGGPAKAADEALDDAADADAAAAIGPVTDMLALVASFNLPAAAPAPAADPLTSGVATPGAAQGATPGATLATVLTAAPAADSNDPAFNDVKQAIEGAVRFALNIPGGGVAPDAKSKDAAAAPSPFATGSHPRAAAVQQQPDADGLAIASVSAKSEAVPDAAILKELAAAAPVTAPVLQASLAMAQAITGAPLEHIAARVGTPGWDNQVGQKIIWMVAGKEQSASLTLNPPDLGPMQVVLSVTGDQATVTFTAAQPEVRQALEAAMPKLREMMGENGIALGSATVNAGTQDGRQAQGGEQPRGQAGAPRSANTGPEAAPISLAPVREGRSGGSAMVDTFA
ncbi:flagellar hook-length control protein FliK [Massilia psychrophila]|uniref:Flagellar hook-length control protein-like C-terminal domain-containing protein n=1 Tax=Massilia psychrophila TaxID=1603353 RepID=A0A2G8SX25_9BURK|nr:flagellar hook-length control protein FliK [Massilia psychrophila]PIL38340.1 hypothetical protein CR103_18335 [Massilia psychrophila]GGE84802.1 hypothetical protein GCM10008020_31990 [Massilia psychrophila]